MMSIGDPVGDAVAVLVDAGHRDEDALADRAGVAEGRSGHAVRTDHDRRVGRIRGPAQGRRGQGENDGKPCAAVLHASSIQHAVCGVLSTPPMDISAADEPPPRNSWRGRHRRWHRRQLPRLPSGSARAGPTSCCSTRARSQPRRLDRARLELHLPGRPLARDDRADARQRAPVQGAGRLHAVRRHRGRAHRGADGGAARGGWPRRRRGASRASARDAGRGQGARAVHRRVGHRRRLLLAGRRRRRLAARRHADARGGAGLGALTVVAERRGHGHRHRARARAPASGPPTATSRPRRS